MASLIIRHVAGSDPDEFQVVRQRDGKSTDPAAVRSPIGFPVEGRPTSDLRWELRWYLEDFLGYPFPPETEHAERVTASLEEWGSQAFNALFGSREAGRFFDEATADGHEDLHLIISSDDPNVLSWPWEALWDSDSGVLAHLCQIERRLNHVRDPQKITSELPTECVNILLVTARPYEGDVGYRSISRRLVHLIRELNLPAQVHVLRPPTFARLREHLHENPGFYHILHFDGHGSYGIDPSGGSAGPGGYVLGISPEGSLVFETDEGKPDSVSAETLSELLREYQVPAVVLNACRSGMVTEGARDPFASVAAALIRCGMRSVLAMAYSVYVSGAQEFLPAFYRRLFDSGDFAQAVRAGRQEMLARPERICARGRFPLRDWLVPVLYQNQPFDFSFAARAKKAAEPDQQSTLPEEALDKPNPHGLIGRDGPVLELERALRARPAGILIHGLGGVGKTTLAAGFIRWLGETDGLGHGCFWFRFDESLRSAEFILNRIGEALLGQQFITLDTEQKLEVLSKVLKQNQFLIVWDNFEVAHGIEGTATKATLSADDGNLLRTFLSMLSGGATKVLITSRSDEEWLGSEQRRRISLPGLSGEERWEYCEAVLRDLGVAIDRTDADMIALMDLLDGHPLAMRAILPRLEQMKADTISEALNTNLAALELSEEDEVHRKLFATLRFIETSLPEELRPLLIPLGLHERFVDGDYLEAMAKQVDKSWDRQQIDRFLEALTPAGLLRPIAGPIHEMHPALTGFLRSTCHPGTPKHAPHAWSRAFVDIIGYVADQLAPRPLHEQRLGFHLHGSNFHHALRLAESLGIDMHFRALLQSLAAYAQNTRDFATAEELFSRLAEARSSAGDEEGVAGACHQLGTVAQEQRDFGAAERWYKRSLAIKERLGNEAGAATTYHQLGRMAEEQRDFSAAEKSYKKALTVFEKLAIENHAAITYHQLGRIAQEQRDFDAAEKCYRKALTVFEKLGIEHHAAGAYHELGIIAAEQRDFSAAEKRCKKALTVFEKLGLEDRAAKTYHELGRIAQGQRNFAAAERWYHKSLAVKEKLGNEHGAASTHGQLGIIAGLQKNFEESARWFLKSIQGFLRTNDPEGARGNAGNFMVLYKHAAVELRPKLKALWEEADAGPFPEDQFPDEAE